jgi:ribosomal protein L23
MALLGKNKGKAVSGKANSANSVRAALKRPRFTEKATIATDQNVYTFVVALDATKHDVRSHVMKKFGKTPVKIRMTTLPAKVRRRGVKPEVKKAYVYLKKGETIDFV